MQPYLPSSHFALAQPIPNFAFSPQVASYMTNGIGHPEGFHLVRTSPCILSFLTQSFILLCPEPLTGTLRV